MFIHVYMYIVSNGFTLVKFVLVLLVFFFVHRSICFLCFSFRIFSASFSEDVSLAVCVAFLKKAACYLV